jgi:serine/threonine protein kinase
MIRITKITEIGHLYTLLSVIGEGASGTVYKAISHSTSRVRAIKQISKTNQGNVTSLL